jgi:GNAT superfamily N-acetyltransferase
MAILIRPGRTVDADDIAQLTGHLGYDVSASDVATRLSHILARSDQQFWVAELDGRAVGWLHAAIAEHVDAEPFVVISGLVVDQRQRRKGIGRLLMEHAEEWARKRGYSIVRLSSTSLRTAAHRFYEQLGYRNIKTQYSFAKGLDTAAQERLGRFVPRVNQ